ncbi:sulfur carrier protein ThiS [bacterium SCSIO 12643]|nr:sulfur carrier protein ThiS [bacterium SCSIO 12643]
MTIQVNNVSHSVENSSSLDDVLKQLDIQTTGIAVAVNEQIITRSKWDSTSVADQDQILIIKATQGG